MASGEIKREEKKRRREEEKREEILTQRTQRAQRTQSREEKSGAERFIAQNARDGAELLASLGMMMAWGAAKERTSLNDKTFPKDKRTMLERLQKIIARAGIASRRHAEQLILSGQVRVNGRVVRELGTKADAEKDRIEAAGKVIKAEERKVYMVLHKPPEIVSAMADPEGRKTLKNCLRGFPSRVYPVGSLEYAASGLIFLTNDGDLAAEMLKHWGEIEQVYLVKVKGMLTLEELERLGKEIGVRMKTVRQPDATRRRAANYWYEVRMRDTKKEEMRRVLLKEQHPVEKMKRIGLGPLTIEGVPQGRYRMLQEKEVEELRRKKWR